MPTKADSLRTIKTFEQLVAYLRDALDWPVQDYDFEQLTFEYEPSELGLKEGDAAKIKLIRQLRPLQDGQPWGIFFVEFEKKRLPVVVLRRILSHLAIKQRASANAAGRPAWNAQDLLFISAFGDDAQADTPREIAFAHFTQQPGGDPPTLEVLGWDSADTVLKLDAVDDTLRRNLRWPDDAANLSAWREQWSAPFRHPLHHTINTADALADALAGLARSIRDRCKMLMEAETDKGQLQRFYAAFKTALLHDLEPAAFADMFAQTITYGLLTAAFTSAGQQAERSTTGTRVVLNDLLHALPSGVNPFLRDLLQQFLTLGGKKKGMNFDELGINNVVELLRDPKTDLPAVLADFGNKVQREDPVIHFYEHFLKAYDKALKVARGVFYTPQPVVGYIVRSVHELLQTEFGLPHGLADTTTWGEMAARFPAAEGDGQGGGLKILAGTAPDAPFVTVLDPATGTATFLVEVIDVIHKHLQAKWAEGGLPAVPAIVNGQSAMVNFNDYWNLYVPQHLLPRLFGYELLMAPYAIAHMKIANKLTETGFHQFDRLGEGNRVRIYLTNALEPASDAGQLNLEGVLPALANEAKAVNAVKRDRRFTVVVGNPPYSGVSSNNGSWISRLVNDYYKVNGEPLHERNPKWLQDDYVKFIRFAQHTLLTASLGIVGIITNHSFLDNPTFRGMRYSLLASVDSISILDLHGNSKKKERSHDGTLDENVFDIQQGVAITLMTLRRPSGKAMIQHAHLYGSRERKYEVLVQLDHKEYFDTKNVSSSSPFYLFLPQNVSARDEYEQGVRLPELMKTNVLGFQSHRDHFAVAFTKDEIRARIEILRSTSLSDADVVQRFDVLDNRDWQIAPARASARVDKQWKDKNIKCAYRPFDFRACYFSTVAMDYPRRELLDHVAWKQNLCLNTTRQTKLPEWRNAMVTNVPAPAVFVELKDGSNLFPLWLYPDKRGLWQTDERRPNFSKLVLQLFATQLNLPLSAPFGLPQGISAESIFYYIYAIFYSPNYRTRYAEFLKIDFPRVPLPGGRSIFDALAEKGGELVALHLLESPKLDALITDYIGPAAPTVEKVSYSNDTVWLDKGQTLGFRGVPQAVWAFHIGGYQVCEKWLKDRKGRMLSAEDLRHYQRVVVALNETIRLMAEIDAVIDQHGGFPGAFAAGPAPLVDAAVVEPDAEVEPAAQPTLLDVAEVPEQVSLFAADVSSGRSAIIGV